jgi:outer membrane protein OmpA-like peptidoglycan-associated protein
LALVFASCALAKSAPLPSYVALPRELSALSGDQLTFELYGEAEFYPDPPAGAVIQRGKHWHADLHTTGMADDTENKMVWARIKPAFLGAGWTVVSEAEQQPFSATLHLQKSSIESWANIIIFNAGDIRMDIVERGPQPMILALAQPAARPEHIVAERGDFPYLAPLPGSKFQSGRQDDSPMMLKLPDAEEPEIVGTATIVKYYAAPDGLSNLQFATVYRDAMTTAGWTVLDQSQGMHQTDAALTAHYAISGRDIWAALHGTPGDYSIAVSDVGAKDLGSELAKNCHITLYGVLFDFNRATLKPESDPALGRVRAMLQKDMILKIEVQGHTDGVGNDTYNQTLSEARANSVVAWLTRHEITADRLTAKGYGKTTPIADNDTDQGRARNRRVEAARVGCKIK